METLHWNRCTEPDGIPYGSLVDGSYPYQLHQHPVGVVELLLRVH